jgi:hypothetical protein
MTVDERIGALTQSLELSILENRDHYAAWKEQDAALNKKFAAIGESLERLANIAMLRQHRLDSHDDRLDTLEGTA